MLGELFAAGAKPQELAAVASLSTIACWTSPTFWPRNPALLTPSSCSIRPMPSVLPRRKLAHPRRPSAAGGPTRSCRTTAEMARSAGVQDPRLSVLLAQLLVQRQGCFRCRSGAANPRCSGDAISNRSRSPTGTGQRRHPVQAMEVRGAGRRGSEGALYNNQGSATEGHVAGARIAASSGTGRRLSTSIGSPWRPAPTTFRSGSSMPERP